MKGNLTGKFLSSVISVQNCSLWFPVLFFHLHLLLSYFFFTYMCFSLTLLPTMHTFCSRDHLWQTLMLYIFWLQSNLLTTQEKKKKTVPVSNCLRIHIQLRDKFSNIYFSLAFVWGTDIFFRTQQSQEGFANKNSTKTSEYCFIQHSLEMQESAWSQSKHTVTFSSQNLFTLSVRANLSFLSNYTVPLAGHNSDGGIINIFKRSSIRENVLQVMKRRERTALYAQRI